MVRIIARNGKSVTAKVVDECDSMNGCDHEHAGQPPCGNNIVDASNAVWNALGLNIDLGVVDVTWSMVSVPRKAKKRCEARPTTEREHRAQNQGNNREMADEGTQRRNNFEFNAEGQDGHNPQPDPTIAEEWLARAEKILDIPRIPNSQRLVYTSFMLEASAKRWWKLLSMKWKQEGVPSTWENFKKEFTNKYVLAVTQEKKEVLHFFTKTQQLQFIKP
ncbi:hypothetical protein RJ639_026731 [Escallonia herrerae]|uniref:Retrotransposon gag domain-containing protein n=1 Tax=Escallonia herrerae TaxID=1293975 RepID=A0AA88X7L0_9ASTE|nr:hypothetical protein RJ639_026731 [Escallonia herrerae]